VNHPRPASTASLIAVVDDDASQRESTRLLVGCFGYRAEAFARARDFLHSPRLEEVSGLILDVVMPEMNGLELQRELARIRPGLPIIFVTAHAQERDERQALAGGAIAVLKKPVPAGALLGALRAALPADQPGAAGERDS
jgi:FixJ family two-component response regulator